MWVKDAAAGFVFLIFVVCSFALPSVAQSVF